MPKIITEMVFVDPAVIGHSIKTFLQMSYRNDVRYVVNHSGIRNALYMAELGERTEVDVEDLGVFELSDGIVIDYTKLDENGNEKIKTVGMFGDDSKSFVINNGTYFNTIKTAMRRGEVPIFVYHKKVPRMEHDKLLKRYNDDTDAIIKIDDMEIGNIYAPDVFSALMKGEDCKISMELKWNENEFNENKDFSGFGSLKMVTKGETKPETNELTKSFIDWFEKHNCAIKPAK